MSVEEAVVPDIEQFHILQILRQIYPTVITALARNLLLVRIHMEAIDALALKGIL